MKQKNCTHTITMPQPIQWAEVTNILNRVPTTLTVALVSVFNKLCLWQRRADTRHRMMHLDDHALADIGLSRTQAHAEALKPFWQK